MPKQDELLRAHQDVLLALARLDAVLAKYEPDEPYREVIRALMREFRAVIDSVDGSPSQLRIKKAAARAGGRR